MRQHQISNLKLKETVRMSQAKIKYNERRTSEMPMEELTNPKSFRFLKSFPNDLFSKSEGGGKLTFRVFANGNLQTFAQGSLGVVTNTRECSQSIGPNTKAQACHSSSGGKVLFR